MDEGANGLMADTLITGTTLVEKESRSIGDVPIGGIVSWAKTLTGVPNLAEGWVECDGSVLVDALSPLNGQTIPDLNGGIFLRGDTTSGGTGGATSAAHTHDESFGPNGTDLAFKASGAHGTGSSIITDRYIASSARADEIPAFKTKSTSVSIIPLYYNVVWIMRVR